MCRVSVVVPTYNRRDVIDRAVESALAQTVADLEVVVVDDASTDDTLAVLGEFDDDRLRVVEHEENRGGSAARNTGIEAAEGEYLALLDSDDAWRPEKLANQLSRMEELDEDWVGTYTGVDFVNAEPSAPRRVAERLFGDDEEPLEGGAELVCDLLMMEWAVYGGSTLLVRADVVDEIGGFDESFPRHQDWEFLVRLLQEGKLACVDEPLVEIFGSDSPSGDTLEMAKSHLFDAFEEEIAACEAEGRPVRAAHQAHLAAAYVRDGAYRKAVATLRKRPPKRLKDAGRVALALFD